MEKKKVIYVNFRRELRGTNRLFAMLDDKSDWPTFGAEAMQIALAQKKAAGKTPPPKDNPNV